MHIHENLIGAKGECIDINTGKVYLVTIIGVFERDAKVYFVAQNRMERWVNVYRADQIRLKEVL